MANEKDLENGGSLLKLAADDPMDRVKKSYEQNLPLVVRLAVDEMMGFDSSDAAVAPRMERSTGKPSKSDEKFISIWGAPDGGQQASPEQGTVRPVAAARPIPAAPVPERSTAGRATVEEPEIQQTKKPSIMPKLVVGFLAIALIGVGVWALSRSNKDIEEPSSTETLEETSGDETSAETTESELTETASLVNETTGAAQAIDDDGAERAPSVSGAATTKRTKTSDQVNVGGDSDVNAAAEQSSETTKTTTTTTATATEAAGTTAGLNLEREELIVNITGAKDEVTVWKTKFKDQSNQKMGIESIQVKFPMKKTWFFSDKSNFELTFDCLVTATSDGSVTSQLDIGTKDDLRDAPITGLERLTQTEKSEIEIGVGEILKNFLTPQSYDENQMPVYSWVIMEEHFGAQINYTLSPTAYVLDAQNAARVALDFAVNTSDWEISMSLKEYMR